MPFSFRNINWFYYFFYIFRVLYQNQTVPYNKGQLPSLYGTVWFLLAYFIESGSHLADFFSHCTIDGFSTVDSEKFYYYYLLEIVLELTYFEFLFKSLKNGATTYVYSISQELPSYFCLESMKNISKP